MLYISTFALQYKDIVSTLAIPASPVLTETKVLSDKSKTFKVALEKLLKFLIQIAQTDCEL